jgi:RHS repeat-associated protein
MDGLGSVRNLTNSTQDIVEQYDYDAFGNLTAPPATGNPYTYTSREYDPETGLLFYRARYYDPATGRFITEDPIEFEGGDVNFYAYVGNNPINAVDPYGKTPKSDKCYKQFIKEKASCFAEIPSFAAKCAAVCLSGLIIGPEVYPAIEACLCGCGVLDAGITMHCLGEAYTKYILCTIN